MHVASEGVETGDPNRPFLARVTIGTIKERDLLAEFEAPSLETARRDADDWMAEYCARTGIGGVKHLEAAAMRSRWERMRDGMPSLPEPGEAYCEALRALACDTNGVAMANETPPSPPRRRQAYPSRSRVVSAVSAARASGIDVAGIRVWPDGSIAVFDARGSDQPSSAGPPACQFGDGINDEDERSVRF